MNSLKQADLPLEQVEKEKISVSELKEIEERDKVNWDKISSIVWFFFSILSLILLCLKLFVFQQVNVVGGSMKPNFEEKEKLLLNKLDAQIERGQVVSVYEYAQMAADANFLTKAFPALSQNKPRFLLKRVVGLPGEEIEILGSKIIIYNKDNPNGVILKEDYIPNETKEKMENGCGRGDLHYARKKLADNQYFVMGDNRCDSLDSRAKDHGPYTKDLIFGRVQYIYWPLEKFNRVEIPNYSYLEIGSDTREKLNKYNNGDLLQIEL